jgi:hypothetical protein
MTSPSQLLDSLQQLATTARAAQACAWRLKKHPWTMRRSRRTTSQRNFSKQAAALPQLLQQTGGSHMSETSQHQHADTTLQALPAKADNTVSNACFALLAKVRRT